MERLFDLEDSPDGRTGVPAGDLPLAARMRPASLGEFVGQDHLLGRGSTLRTAIEEGRPHSMILYGPPGTGKTTLARLLAVNARRLRGGLGRQRRPRRGARGARSAPQHRRDTSGEGTIFFLDEIHRFNKAQQDTLLPAVEEGLVVLVGATTENPYFEVNSALLSRCRVYELRALDDEHVLVAAAPRARRRARHRRGRRGSTTRRSTSCARARAATREPRWPRWSWPARRWGDGAQVTLRVAEDALQRSAILYDKGGDLHYDLISAWIKATRGSDPDASLLYLAAMLEGGEDPRFIARRMVILASEDVGNADPRALAVAVAAAHAVEHVGMPGVRAQPRPGGGLPGARAQVERLLLGDRAGPRVGARARHAASRPRTCASAAYPGAKKLGRGRDYDYPHDLPRGLSEQELMPDEARRASASSS